MIVFVGAISGAGLGLGLLVIALGIRGTPPSPPRRPARQVLATEPLIGRALAGFGVALAVWVLTEWVVGAALAALLAVALPASWKRARVADELVQRTEAVASWTEMLRDTLAAAAGLEQAIVTTAPNAPELIRGPTTQLARRLDRGERLVPGLRRLAAELGNPAADLVVAALVTAAQREARDLVPLLGALARSTRAEAEMRVRVHASRARLRTAVRVVVGSLGMFAGGLIVFNPAYLQPYQTITGQLVLLLVAAIMTCGYVLMQRMARLRTPDRFLTRIGTPDPARVDP